MLRLIRVLRPETVREVLEVCAEDRGAEVLPRLRDVSDRPVWLAKHLVRYCWFWAVVVEEDEGLWRLAGYAAVTGLRRRFGRLTGCFHFCQLRWVGPVLLVRAARELFRVIDPRLEVLEAYIRVRDRKLKRLGQAFGFSWRRGRRTIKGSEYYYGRRWIERKDTETGTGTATGGTAGDARGRDGSECGADRAPAAGQATGTAGDFPS